MLRFKRNQQGILCNDKGQSIFELIVFVPLMLIVLTMMITTGNAINASINQQKAVRGYFYYILRGNSTGQRKSFIDDYIQLHGMGIVGMQVIGWRRMDTPGSDELTYAACFRYNSFLENAGNDTNCDDPIPLADNKTPIIRVYTAYGICSETYQKSGEGVKTFVPRNLSGKSEACVLRM